MAGGPGVGDELLDGVDQRRGVVGELTKGSLDGGGSDGSALLGQGGDEFVGGPRPYARRALSTRAAVGRNSVAGSASLATALW
jgi:hypothetical protein